MRPAQGEEDGDDAEDEEEGAPEGREDPDRPGGEGRGGGGRRGGASGATAARSRTSGMSSRGSDLERVNESQGVKRTPDRTKETPPMRDHLDIYLGPRPSAYSPPGPGGL